MVLLFLKFKCSPHVQCLSTTATKGDMSLVVNAMPLALLLCPANVFIVKVPCARPHFILFFGLSRTCKPHPPPLLLGYFICSLSHLHHAMECMDLICLSLPLCRSFLIGGTVSLLSLLFVGLE